LIKENIHCIARYNLQTVRISLAILFFCVSMLGCVKRTISIMSQPSGALVWVNDREVGRTPITIEFLYYGEYDVRLEKDGQEPIMTTRWAKSPAWDLPVIDLFVETFAKDFESRVEWHFEMEQRNDDPELLLLRAHGIREGMK